MVFFLLCTCILNNLIFCFFFLINKKILQFCSHVFQSCCTSNDLRSNASYVTVHFHPECEREPHIEIY